MKQSKDSRVCAWREGPAGLADAAAGPAAAAQSFDLELRGNHLSNATCLIHVFFRSDELMQQTQLAVLDK